MNTMDWNALISRLPGASFLQTREWAAVKKEVGWTSEEMVWRDDAGDVTAAGSLLVRSMSIFGFGPRVSIGYIPRGPLLDWRDSSLRAKLLRDLEQLTREKRLVFLKIDPEVVLSKADGEAEPGSPPEDEVCRELLARKWRFSPEQVQFKNTMVIHLDGDEDVWLARMKQKTRYNLRLAQKNGVTVRRAEARDLPLLYAMFVETANRDGFILRPEAYYLRTWEMFMRNDMAEGLIAEVDGVAVAGLIYLYLASRAWYVYGMSTSLHREKMPNYLLQWEAMRSAKAKGCLEYDLWGAPDTLSEADPMYGVYRFKEGLGGEFQSTIGAWDFPARPGLYFIYHQVIPRILVFTRFIRRRQLKQEIS